MGKRGRKCTNFITAKSLLLLAQPPPPESQHTWGAMGHGPGLTSRDICLSDSGARPGCPMAKEQTDSRVPRTV